MRRIGVAAALVLVVAGTLGGLWAGGMFSGGGSSSTAAAASQTQDSSSQDANQDNTAPSDQSVYLGVQLTQTSDGPTVGAVIAGSPAENAGLQRGDVINAIDGTSVSDVQDVRDALEGKNPSDKVTISITRDGSTQDLTATLEAPPEPLAEANPILPELNGIPRDELFSHLLGGSFQFTDQDGKSHTASVDLGTVTAVDTSAKTISVDLNAGGSKQYTISGDVTTVPSDLTQFANGDNVVIVSVDGNLHLVIKGGGFGLPFFGGMHGFGFERGHAFGDDDGTFNVPMPRGKGMGGF